MTAMYIETLIYRYVLMLGRFTKGFGELLDKTKSDQESTKFQYKKI
jgi:hypothetical protein